MIEYLLKIILFTLLINWSISMHVLNQVSEASSIKRVAVLISLVSSAAAAIVILL